jgi:hypothetical protein
MIETGTQLIITLITFAIFQEPIIPDDTLSTTEPEYVEYADEEEAGDKIKNKTKGKTTDGPEIWTS